MKVMNAHIGSQSDLTNPGYIFEPKYDGIRALCIVNKGMKFISRNGVDRTAKHPDFKFRSKIKATSCILDGEIVAYDKKGRPDFSLLQQGGGKTEFVVFDILEKDGRNLTSLPLKERKKILQQTVANGAKLKKVSSFKDGKKLWLKMKKKGYEGVMAKEIGGTYRSGRRSSTWLKIKMIDTIDCVIIGYVQKKRSLSSLALALYKQGKLYYIGQVGTGFSEDEVEKLYEKLSKIKSKKKPIVDNVPPNMKHIMWVRPKYVAEIKYLEFTRHNRLRATAYVRLRTDKKPEECTFAAQAK